MTLPSNTTVSTLNNKCFKQESEQNNIQSTSKHDEIALKSVEKVQQEKMIGKVFWLMILETSSWLYMQNFAQVLPNMRNE